MSVTNEILSNEFACSMTKLVVEINRRDMP